MACESRLSVELPSAADSMQGALFAKLPQLPYSEAILNNDGGARLMTSDEFLEKFYDGEEDFSGVDLSGQNLEGLRLDGLNFSEANFTNAVMEGVFLEGANLTNANLSGANLRGAELEGTNLTGATLDGAILDGVYFANTIMPDGSIR